MEDINDIFKIGDIVVAGGNWVNPLLEYSEQNKSALESMPIDINWKPLMMYVAKPDTRNTKVFLRKGDRLKIISKAINPPNYAKSFLFKVQDENNNEYYLSCEWFNR